MAGAGGRACAVPAANAPGSHAPGLGHGNGGGLLNARAGRRQMTCPACRAPAGDNARFCAMCGSPINAPSAAREARKNVAIFFMDLVGSTALAEMLDPESWRQIIDRYFDAVSSAIAAYGGAVEKVIGDAVMAVFGATVSHEDDALRAVRAAMEAVAKVGGLNVGLIASHKVKLEIRCGICSGEVIAITEPSGDFRVIGDPVNTAARLQTAAEPGQILIDAASARMVRAVIGLDPVRPLELKGKGKPVPAWLVTGIGLPADAAVDPPATPLIGREHELSQLRSVHRQGSTDNQVGIVPDDRETTAELAGIQEISWALRHVLAQLGRTNPVIMVWEDLQWAETTLLDMIDGVVTWLTDVPVLLICVSRTDPRDARPGWGDDMSPAVTLEINPLSYEQSAEPVSEIAMHEEVYAHQQEVICEQVARECEGNPLFAELMLDVVSETASSAKLPPTISAVLTARLDQL